MPRIKGSWDPVGTKVNTNGKNKKKEDSEGSKPGWLDVEDNEDSDGDGDDEGGDDGGRVEGWQEEEGAEGIKRYMSTYYGMSP